MNSVVLQDANGAHLGFMLCSPGLDHPAGDCVFMAVPIQAELFDTRPPGCCSGGGRRARVRGG